MSEPIIEVEKRDRIGGGKISRRLAEEGLLAAVVYGGKKDSVPITVDRKSLLELINKATSENVIFLLKMAGTEKERHAMIKEMQVDPVSRELLHVDFLRVMMDEVLRVNVQVELEGSPIGIREEGGVLDFVTREVEVECLPRDIPDTLKVDVTDLHINQHVEVSELVVPEGVTITEEQDRVVASVVIPREIVEEEEVEEEELLLEAEAEEPEVIGRGKEEEEGEAAAEEESEG